MTSKSGSWDAQYGRLPEGEEEQNLIERAYEAGKGDAATLARSAREILFREYNLVRIADLEKMITNMRFRKNRGDVPDSGRVVCTECEDMIESFIARWEEDDNYQNLP